MTVYNYLRSGVDVPAHQTYQYPNVWLRARIAAWLVASGVDAETAKWWARKTR